MSKKANATETATANLNATPEDLFAELFEGMSPEEIQAMLDASGQSAHSRGDRVPVFKVNMCSLEDEDVNGKSIKKGHFVLNQVKKTKDGNTVLEDVGTDFGANPTVTVVKVGTQFSYFPTDGDKKKMCSSQIVFDKSQPVGSNLGFVCNDKSCPRRKEGIDKKERCTCQFVSFLEVGEENSPAVMYVKGDSFMPFSDYMKEAGMFPLFAFKTQLSTEKKINGSVTYFVVKPKLDLTQPNKTDLLRLKDVAVKIGKDVQDAQAQRQLAHKPASSGLPANTTVEGQSTAKQSSGLNAQAEDAAFDDIKF